MLSNDELKTLLQEHILFMSSSCRSFDAGFDSEAKRLAVSARVLVHDTTQSHSLLSQLGIKRVMFCSTAIRWDPKNLVTHQGLVSARYRNGSWSYEAPLDNRPPGVIRWVPFDEWWKEIVFDDRKGNTLTRKDIVLTLANKEGGAHVDPALTPSYEAIVKRSSFWLVRTSEGDKSPEGKMELIAMRQIAHELISTLKAAGYTA